uniref:Uncharacterized protein n=1 Tax=viral metagenome TaxID=1070528 RepID=A0A6C0J2F0_9ZZZZ
MFPEPYPGIVDVPIPKFEPLNIKFELVVALVEVPFAYNT